MMRMTENGYERPSPHSRAIQTEGLDVCLDRREQATAFKKQIDSVRSWHERMSPKFRRACSAGQLLFQVVGIAGYAGYFASMHTFLRLFSSALMAAAWYVIYRVRGAAQL
jgi:hypothetical protein